MSHGDTHHPGSSGTRPWQGRSLQCPQAPDPAIQTNRAHGRVRFPFRAPSEGLRDPAPTQLARQGARGHCGARAHTHAHTGHGCSHSTRPTVLVRAIKWSFTNSTGGWVTTKVTKNKTSVLCHVGSQLRTWERNEVPGRTCREPGKDRNGTQRCPPAAAWVCAPTARTARKAQHTEGHIRRNLKREGSWRGRQEHITEQRSKPTCSGHHLPCATHGQCCLARRHTGLVPGKPCSWQNEGASSCTDTSTGHMWPRLWEPQVKLSPPFSTPTGCVSRHLYLAGKLST